MPDKPPSYTIHLDGNWSLEDLYKFPRAYEQAYFFLYAVETDSSDYQGEEVDHIFRAFPWQGGYSAVGFYNNLKYKISPSRRPKIISISYASPGWLELGLVLAVALNVEKIVQSVCKSAEHINETYNKIIRGLQERELRGIKLNQEKIRLKRSELKFISESNAAMCRLLGLKNLSELEEKTGNPLITLKMVLSFYRRIRLLADYQSKGKAQFENSREGSDE